jgi:hypothetical protein
VFIGGEGAVMSPVCIESLMPNTHLRESILEKHDLLFTYMN